MKKFTTKTVFDYLVGNDIVGFDIDELENNPEFMAEVVCKDKNSYNLCSDAVKGEYAFTKRLLEHYKDDVEFALRIYYDYENYSDSKDDENAELFEEQYFEINILMEEITKNEDELVREQFQSATTVSLLIEKTDFELIKENINEEIPGIGFYYEQTKFGHNENVINYIAESFIRNLFFKVINLEENIHSMYKTYEDFELAGKYTAIVKLISYYDNDLSEYAALNPKVLIVLDKDLERIKKRWDKYETYKQKREIYRRIYEEEKYDRIIERVKDYVRYNPCRFEADDALVYIGEKFGVKEDIIKALNEYYGDGETIEESYMYEDNESIAESIIRDMQKEEDYIYSIPNDMYIDYNIQMFDKINIKDAPHLNAIKKIFREELGYKKEEKTQKVKNKSKYGKVVNFNNKRNNKKKDD